MAQKWIVPAAIVVVIGTLTTHGKFSVSGDEPHYLMIAQSLLADADLDLANNYASDDGRLFGREHLEAGPHVRLTRQGATWSSHDIGVPVVLLPLYSAARGLSTLPSDPLLARLRQSRGLFAYSLISWALIAATAWAGFLLVSAFAREMPFSRATTVVLTLTLSPPVLAHAFLIFPDNLAFVATCVWVWIVSYPDEEQRIGRMAIGTAMLGAMPWLHRKYSFFVVGLAFVFVWRHRTWLRRQHRATLATVIGLFVLPQLALHLFTLHAWGVLGGPQMVAGLPFSLSGFGEGAVGLLFDREHGLLSYAPIYLLVPMAFALTWRVNRDLLAPVLLLFLPMAAFVEWRAGFSPAARHLVPAMPLLAIAAARALEYRSVRWTGAALLILQIAITAVVWQHPRMLWPLENGDNQALRIIPLAGPLYARLLPSMGFPGAVARGLMVATALAVVTSIAVWFERRGTP
jgi:hypothetical protein